MILVFSAEPNFLSWAHFQVTEAILDHIENYEDQTGELVLPDALLLFNRAGAEITLKISTKLRISD